MFNTSFMSKIDSDFGALIKQKVREAGFRQYQIAEMMGISPEYFSQLLSGHNWYLEYVMQALKIFGMSIVLDGDSFYIESGEELDRIKLARDIQDILKKHNVEGSIPGGKKNTSHHKKKAI